MITTWCTQSRDCLHRVVTQKIVVLLVHFNISCTCSSTCFARALMCFSRDFYMLCTCISMLCTCVSVCLTPPNVCFYRPNEVWKKKQQQQICQIQSPERDVGTSRSFFSRRTFWNGMQENLMKRLVFQVRVISTTYNFFFIICYYWGV